ncbi:hypothetical protein AMJ39_03715 [candidate division TA06 bacterium DG_24]|uniref:Nucleotidyl transferase AbiEii/AbiGii toxin family protein n=2 Tax=Bacteria division TA06 TaxID=1156500 RepID=A0A0S8G9S1_UNCT6|nr:MAG: hypothetical protein AMJ39_03715 [candidate division TA06 bacterium DG_24]KPK68442.1 MAG: hypothetical protein AMJ82_08255 [candidate division TA06 bacterium SM23_40]
MRISKERLVSEAEATGFRAEVMEKAIHLLNLLESLGRHPFLQSRLALKGGTALNLFVFDVPRLSVDLDLNYIGAADRNLMLEERPKIEKAIRAVCAREDLAVRRVPEDHAGGKWVLRYRSALGLGGNLEIDLNFMFRIPLWPPVVRDSRSVGSYRASGILTLDTHELAASKLVALLTRRQARDLFDVHQLLTRLELDRQNLRPAFVALGATTRTDWRTISTDDVDFTVDELRNHLIPMLRSPSPLSVKQTAEWGGRLVDECRRTFEIVLPLSGRELQFLDRLLDAGEIDPSLLTSDEALSDRIRRHPLLQWKALNIRQYKGK